MGEQPVELNTYSSRITQPKSQGASQAMLLATGLSNADLDKPQIGIAACWYEGNPCNMHLNDLAAAVKEGISLPSSVACGRLPHDICFRVISLPPVRCSKATCHARRREMLLRIR